MGKHFLAKIQKINNFGSFKHFQASSDLECFKKYNLIWGLNGSGKTTLSRFFECLNLGEIPSVYKKDGYTDNFVLNILDENNVFQNIDTFKDNFGVGKIKIFNNKFIEENLALNSDIAQTKSITYILGEDKNELKKQITDLGKKRQTYFIEHKGKSILQVAHEYNNLKSNLENQYTNIACSIRADLCISNSQSYNRDHFFTDFSKFINTECPNVTEIEKEEARKKYIQPHRNKIGISLNSIITETDFTIISNLLKEKVYRKNNCNDELVNWLETGLKLKTNNQCPFCNHNIEQVWELRYKEILELLKKDDSYVKYENEIYKYINLLLNGIQNINININQLRINDFVISIEESELDNYKSVYNDYISEIQKIIEYLQNKQKNKEKVFDISNSAQIINDFENMKEVFNNKIINNDSGIDTLHNDKRKAKDIVIEYYIAINYDKICSQINQIDDLLVKKESILRELAELDTQLNSLKAELSNQNIPIQEIEKYINIVFGYEKFHLKFEESANSYIITRDGHDVAKNLSEGEKTVIAFAYFLATLKSNNFELKNSIVVIDDPVSSLDQQYLFNLLNLLMFYFDNPNNFSQLFILTHNFYFFKKIRAILKNKNTNDDESIFAIFQISKKDTSYIVNADKYLRDFDSEYSHTIKYLKNALKLNDEELKEIPLGNSIRKILEIFLAFRCPKEKTIYTRYKKITKEWSDIDKNKYKYLQDIANATSHTEGCEDLEALEEFKLFIGKDEINQLFNFIKEVDNDHFKYLP